MKTRSSALFPFAALLSLGAQAAPRVTCHVDYGGETTHLEIAPVTDPAAALPQKFGSYFLFRVVTQTPPAPAAAVRILVYADLDEGPLPLQVAEYPWPPARRQGKPGFTGWQSVYEPIRDGELQYWCEWSPR